MVSIMLGGVESEWKAACMKSGASRYFSPVPIEDKARKLLSAAEMADMVGRDKNKKEKLTEVIWEFCDHEVWQQDCTTQHYL